MTRIAIAYLLIFAALNFAFITPLELNSANKSARIMIDWQGHDRLTWSDFKGKAKNWASVSALTASAIEYAYECSNGQLDISVKAVFIPEESWVKSDAKNSYILSHEQLHFDITEIFARKLRKELSSKVGTCHDIRKIDGIARKVLDEWKKEQHKYDADTGHSVNKELQEQWRRKIIRDLENYSAYTLEKWNRNY